MYASADCTRTHQCVDQGSQGQNSCHSSYHVTGKNTSRFICCLRLLRIFSTRRFREKQVSGRPASMSVWQVIKAISMYSWSSVYLFMSALNPWSLLWCDGIIHGVVSFPEAAAQNNPFHWKAVMRYEWVTFSRAKVSAERKERARQRGGFLLQWWLSSDCCSNQMMLMYKQQP